VGEYSRIVLKSIALSPIQELIVAAVSGGAITAIANYFLSKRRENRGDFSAIIGTWQKDNDRLRLQEIESRARISALEAKYSELHTRFISLILWIKANEGRKIILDTQYEDEFLHPLGLSLDDEKEALEDRKKKK
jgi:hypothetical protein